MQAISTRTVCARMCVCLHIFLYPSICVCAIVALGMHVFTSIYQSVCVCVCMRMYVCVCAHIHIHTHNTMSFCFSSDRCHGSQGPRLFSLSRMRAHSHTANSNFVAQNIPILIMGP